MQWIDQIRRVKIVLVLAAVVIAVVSLVVSHILIRDLAGEERAKMEVWAEAMRTLNHADENTDINLVLRVINSNNTIPVVVLDPHGQVQAYRNIEIDHCNDSADTTAFLADMGKQLLAANRNIRITLDDDRSTDYIDVCYDD